ncbi:MAG: MFS transporter [Gemmatimonadaceae bacterium]
MFITNVDTAIVSVGRPSIRASLRASGGELELVVSGYILAYAMLLITGARRGDTRGYRRVFLTGLGAFTVASLACGLAPSPSALILARIVQGAVAGQVLGGVIISANLFNTGWRPMFLINVPIGISLMLAGLRFLPVDRPGTVLQSLRKFQTADIHRQ